MIFPPIMKFFPPLLGVLLAVVLAFSSCHRQRFREQFAEVMNNSISFPEKVSCVWKRELYPMPDSLSGKTKLIIFVGSSECTKCSISQSIRYTDLYLFSKEVGSFELVLLFSLNNDERDEIIDFICSMDFPFPVFIDEDRYFLRLNPFLASDKRFQCICVDRTGRPLYVGNPINGDSWMELFKKVIS